jgi:hypothetical protein
MVHRYDASQQHIAYFPTPSSSKSRRIQQRQRYPSHTAVNLSNTVITALNYVSSSLSSIDTTNEMVSSHINIAPSISNSQQSFAPSQSQSQQSLLQPSTMDRVHDRIYDAAQRYSRHLHSCGSSSSTDDTINAPLDPSIILHDGYISSPAAMDIIAAKVSLPQQSGTADLLALLPPHLASVYSQPHLLLRPPAVKLHRRRAFKCDNHQYKELLLRMISRNMIAFTTDPLVVNGLFGVPKDNGESIRLIIDARPVNSMFIDSPPVSLPTPDLIASLNVQRDTVLHAAKIDLDNFYHRIRLPKVWWRYFCLPCVRAGDIGLNNYSPDMWVYPMCTSLPMGFSHSVFLAQAVHEHIIDTRVPLLARESRIVRQPFDYLQAATVSNDGITYYPLCTSTLPSPTGDFIVNRVRHSVYIDDLNIYHHDPIIINAAMDQYLSVMISVGLPAKPSKVVRPTADGLDCLGIHVNGRTGEVGVAVDKLHSLRASTLRLINIGECTGRELAHIIGKWTWAFLIRRPAMAVFSAVYRFIDCAKDSRYILWPSVCRELWTAAHIAPLLYASIRCDWAPVVIASDASELAAGVVYSDTNSTQIESLSTLRAVPGEPINESLDSFINQSTWKVAISHRWRDKTAHINELEMRSSLTAIRWAIKRPDVLMPSSACHPSPACHRKLLLVVDSSSVAGAVRKGRSSAHRLLRPLRSISALLLASHIHLFIKWIPSASNPADRPSRW